MAKNSKAEQIVGVVGTDDAEVKRAAKELAARMAPPDAGEFGSEMIDGAVETVDLAAAKLHETCDCLETLPFFGDKLVWLKNVLFLGDTVAGRSETVLEALERLTSILQRGLPPSVRFLLNAKEIDKRRSFYKTFSKIAEIRVFDEIDTSKAGWENEAAAACEAAAEKEGIRLEPDAMEYFVAMTGGSTRAVTSEMTKLALFVGPNRDATDADVRLIVSRSKTGVVFDLGKAISRRDLSGALQTLDQLLRQGETAIGILLASVIPTVRNLLLARDLLERHKLRAPAANQAFNFVNSLNNLPERATRHLPRKKDGGLNAYGLAFAAVDAKNFKAKELRAGLEACMEANVQLITSQLEPRIVLGRLIIRLLAKEG